MTLQYGKLIRSSLKDNSIIVRHKDGTKSIKTRRYTRTDHYDLELQDGDKFDIGEDSYEVTQILGGCACVRQLGTDTYRTICRDGSDMETVLKENK